MTLETSGSEDSCFDLIYELSLVLNTGLDKNTLVRCVSLIENGVNPEALAIVIKELTKEKQC
jgi:mitotic-spindle organizing protein 1